MDYLSMQQSDYYRNANNDPLADQQKLEIRKGNF